MGNKKEYKGKPFSKEDREQALKILLRLIWMIKEPCVM